MIAGPDSYGPPSIVGYHSGTTLFVSAIIFLPDDFDGRKYYGTAVRIELAVCLSLRAERRIPLLRQ